jgi:DNA-binding HxlR family transcriptional regulator
MTASSQASDLTFDVNLDDRCRVPGTRAIVRDVFTMISDKWSMPVIEALNVGPVRFTDLMKAVEGISHRMLTRTLRSLERDGLVSRTSYAESPPRVEYELTSLGITLLGPVRAFIEWTHEHQREIERSRTAFDA